MAEFINDRRMFIEAVLDTPFRGPIHFAVKTAEEAACLPGNAVKSIERDTDGSGFPMYHGILVSYDETCIVRAHQHSLNNRFVWRGSKEEYHKTWEVD